MFGNRREHMRQQTDAEKDAPSKRLGENIPLKLSCGGRSRNPVEGDHASGAKPISDSSLKAISNRPRADW
jgi:hypothetical protein